MSDWFSSFASSALKFADDLADSLVTQANEAQQSLQEEQRKLKSEEEIKKQIQSTHQLLPWETMVEARQILSKALMENILALSVNDKNFLVRAPNANEVDFSIQDFAPTAMKMIELDSNLARMHAKLSPKMNEEEFWFNYYCRIMYLRACSGIEGLDAQKAAEKWNKEDIVMVSSSEAPPLAHIAGTHSSGSNRHASSPIVVDKGDVSSSIKSLSSNKSPVKEEDEINLDELENLNLDDLGDLQDLDMLNDDMLGEDFENIGSSECNDDELEAQIAKELGEM